MPLYLVDGHGLAYRSYYAFIRRPLTTSKGEETSAVFGFLKTILALLDKYDPSHLAVVFDSPEATFRTDLYPEYKANRPPMPESLAAQLPRIASVLEAMAIATLSAARYEADDIIATMARRIEGDMPVRIVSGDKDLFQTLSERTHIIRPGRNGMLDEEFDVERLRKEIGLTPAQFVDHQALMGDATDNIPGVQGVGPKTARRLIDRFGSLEAVYEHLDEITPESLRGKLAAGRESAFLSRELVRLDHDVPIEISLDAVARRPFDTTRLRELLKELEFLDLADTIDVDPPPQREEPSADYVLVDEEKKLETLVETLRGFDEVAVDVESSERDPMRAVLAGISLSVAPGRAWYVPIRSALDVTPTLLLDGRESAGLDLDLVRKHLGPVLGGADIRKVGQNIKYDTIVLANAGITLGGIAFDTMIASYCLDPARRSHGLDNLAADVFGHKMIPFKSLFDTRTGKKDIRTVPLERVTPYACEDADYTLRLKHHFAPLLEASQVKTLFEEVEMPLGGVLTRMEMRGVALDVPFLRTLSEELSRRLDEIRESIYREAGEEFNINSTARLQDILFRKLGLKPVQKTKTGYSTDIEVLKRLSGQHVLPDLIIEYRTLTKLKSTYIDALPRLVHPETRRVHTSYNQAVASTGRLSSSDPNLQNIPIRTALGRKIRKAFVAGGDGWTLLDADYSQIELRILAHLSGDAELVKAFREDEDVHRRTAARMMGVSPDAVTGEMRSRAKTVNFGIIYGMGARGLAQSLEISVPEAKRFIEDYFNSYPGVRRFIDETIAAARRDRAVSTLLGRVRQVPDLDSSNRRSQAFAERIAVNTPIQGTAADIIKVAMVRIDQEIDRRKLRARMILQVHDELVFDLPEEETGEVESVVREAMESAITLDVPLKVDVGVGRDWLAAHG